MIGRSGTTLAGGRDRRLDLGEVAHGLDQHQVDAAVAQPGQLLGEDRLRLGGVHGAERGHQLAGRAEVAGDEGAVLVGDLAREPAAASLSSWTRSPRPCMSSRGLVPPNVLVVRICAPASA